jgi:hypothetical protein
MVLSGSSPCPSKKDVMPFFSNAAGLSDFAEPSIKYILIAQCCRLVIYHKTGKVAIHSTAELAPVIIMLVP